MRRVKQCDRELAMESVEFPLLCFIQITAGENSVENGLMETLEIVQTCKVSKNVFICA